VDGKAEQEAWIMRLRLTVMTYSQTFIGMIGLIQLE